MTITLKSSSNRLKMGFQNMRYSNPEFTCLVDININVPPGINYCTGLLACQDIRAMRNFFQKVMFYQHISSSLIIFNILLILYAQICHSSCDLQIKEVKNRAIKTEHLKAKLSVTKSALKKAYKEGYITRKAYGKGSKRIKEHLGGWESSR